MQAQYAITRAEYEWELDSALAGSFPASDPPPWTLGASSWMDLGVTVPKTGTAPAATEVIAGERVRVGGSRLAGLGEAIAMTAMVPLGILLAGAPVVVLMWGIAKLAAAISSMSGNI